MIACFLLGVLFRVRVVIQQAPQCPDFHARLMNPDRFAFDYLHDREVVTAADEKWVPGGRIAPNRVISRLGEAEQTCQQPGYLSEDGTKCVIELAFATSTFQNLKCSLSDDLIKDDDGDSWRTLHCEYAPQASTAPGADDETEE